MQFGRIHSYEKSPFISGHDLSQFLCMIVCQRGYFGANLNFLNSNSSVQ